jgi:hypothetical protein
MQRVMAGAWIDWCVWVLVVSENFNEGKQKTMSNDELLFQAANAATAAVKLTREAWEAQTLPLDYAKQLKQHATQLVCAATELEQRAVGVNPPKEG